MRCFFPLFFIETRPPAAPSADQLPSLSSVLRENTQTIAGGAVQWGMDDETTTDGRMSRDRGARSCDEILDLSLRGGDTHLSLRICVCWRKLQHAQTAAGRARACGGAGLLGGGFGGVVTGGGGAARQIGDGIPRATSASCSRLLFCAKKNSARSFSSTNDE